MKNHYLIPILLLAVLLSSCASFERYRAEYNRMVEQSELESAAQLIKRKRFYKKDRNRVLYYLELGALARMQGELEKSNELLNQADYLIEDRQSSIGQEGLSMISNPRVKPYQTEYYENIAVHYLKSLNYLQLNDLSAARVEARRTNIRLQELNDAVPDKPLKYQDDVLGHIIMGLGYEANGEWNNAFIAYRNAANLFIEEGQLKPYMGVRMPDQLKCDLIRMAKLNGFRGEVSRYLRILRPQCEEQVGEGGSLVIFWENGQGPIKEENILGFNILRNQSNNELRFVNRQYGLDYNVGERAYREYDGFQGINNVSVALPSFRSRSYPLHSAEVRYPGGRKELEIVEDLNVIAKQSLRDRFGRELANALMRLAAKEALEAGLRSIKTKKKNEDEEEGDKEDGEEKKEQEEDEDDEEEDEYSETLGILLGATADLVNTLTERADIRSWQSLPAEISYRRIPLKRGGNDITVTFYNRHHQRMESARLLVKGHGGLEVRNLITPDDRVIQPTKQQIKP